MYRTGTVPTTYAPDWIRQEFSRIAAAMSEPADFAYLRVQHKPIDKPRDGMVAFADGVDWNPGAGRGCYVFTEGAWSKL